MKTVMGFATHKQNKQKITVLTCYDYTSARILSNTNVDCVLVGDSGSMTMLGADDTTQATMNDMLMMTKAVVKGIEGKFIIADMPFMSYRKSLADTMKNVQKFIQSGAQAIKLEGAAGNFETIRHIVDSGVPVMGHIGLTPQHIHALGGFKVQGKTQNASEQLIEQAEQLQAAGCFSIVLECVPGKLAAKITQALAIPTIGIGAGKNTDGQVLVFHDLLGLQTDFQPKFLKKYLDGADIIANSINQFVTDVTDERYPAKEHTFEGIEQ